MGLLRNPFSKDKKKSDESRTIIQNEDNPFQNALNKTLQDLGEPVSVTTTACSQKITSKPLFEQDIIKVEHNQKVNTYSELTQSQKAILPILFNTIKSVENDGYATIVWIITTNHNATDHVVKDIKLELIKQFPMEDQEKINGYIDYLTLTDYYSEYIRYDKIFGGNKELWQIKYTPSSELLEELRKLVLKKVQMGNTQFIVGDRWMMADKYYVDSGWNLGGMDEAINGLKEIYRNKYGKSPTQEKVHCFLVLMNFEWYEIEQRHEFLYKFPFDNNFNSKHYEKSIIQITSIETASQFNVIRHKASEKGSYDINMILHCIDY